MAVVSQHGGSARPPWLQSWAARIGIAVLVGLSIYVAARYWAEIDPPLAVLTIGAELVAFAGLGVAAWQWSRSRRLAAGAVTVTAIAAAWCAFTMFQDRRGHARQGRQRGHGAASIRVCSQRRGNGARPPVGAPDASQPPSHLHLSGNDPVLGSGGSGGD